MALTCKFIDSVNHYATAQLTRKYTNVSAGVSVVAAGRNGGNAILFLTSGNYTSVTLDAQQCAMVLTGYKTPMLADIAIARFYDTATLHVELRLTATGQLTVCRNGTVLADSGAVALQTNTYYHIGFAAKIDDSTGTYDVWLNGTKVITGTGDTRNAGNASINAIRIGPSSTNGGNCHYCDIAMYNGASYTDADFPGDCRVMLQNTAGPGAHSDWTGAYTDVDDATPDDDTTALTDATAGNISTFAMTPIAGTGDVKGRQLVVMARKDDSGSRTIATVERLGSTDVVGATQATGLTYVAYREISTAKPGGGAWTITDCNNAEVGVKTIA